MLVSEGFDDMLTDDGRPDDVVSGVFDRTVFLTYHRASSLDIRQCVRHL